MLANKITSYRWEIDDFSKQYWEAYNKNENLVSNVFSIATRPSIYFAMVYNISRTSYFKNSNYGVVLKNCDIDQSLNFDVKIWMEDDKGQKFGEHSAQNYAFKTVGDQWTFNVKNFGYDWNLFLEVYKNYRPLFICCELLDLNLNIASITLNPKPVSIENSDQEFHQDVWALYKEEIHDAIIKVDDKQFKVLKFLFIAHSKVFKSMFLPKFKEEVKSEIQINDVDEKTMEYLVKWIYTNQLEEDSPIEKLFAASDKYDIKVLKNTCIQRMISTFTNSNAFQRLVLSVKYSNEILKNASLDYISRLPHIDFINFFGSHEWDELKSKNAKTAQEIMELLQNKMKK